MSNKILSLFFRGQADKAIHYFLTLSFALSLSLYCPYPFVGEAIAFFAISSVEFRDDNQFEWWDIAYNLFGALTAILINMPLLFISL